MGSNGGCLTEWYKILSAIAGIVGGVSAAVAIKLLSLEMWPGAAAAFTIMVFFCLLDISATLWAILEKERRE